MRIAHEPFGQVDGQPVEQFTLENDQGVAVKITNYGGIVTSIVVPDRRGTPADIVCGFDALEGYFSKTYRENSPYFGCIVGRYAGRIKDGTFTIDERRYPIATNDGPNHLHGGIVGFDKRVWDAELSEEQGDGVLRLTLVSRDGEEGYPGTVKVAVEYRLTQENQLKIHYTGQTDQATPLSLTNHTYFNLNGFSDNVLDHEVQIESDRYLVPDETNVPVGEERAVARTVCDFRQPGRLGDSFQQLPDGFEHYYVFADSGGAVNKVARFSEPSTGRTLEVYTSEPGMLFYTGYYTSDGLARNDQTRFGQFRAFCCEASKYPNGPNIPKSPRSVLQAGQPYDETTVFKFGW